MPNIIENYLELTFAQTENDRRMTTLVAEIEKGNFFNYLWPIALHTESLKRDFFEEEEKMRRNACIRQWGTRQDAYDVINTTVSNVWYLHYNCWQPTLCVTFSTAWSAPIALYRNLVPMGYDIYAEFYDAGDATAGVFKTVDRVLFEAYATDVTNPNDPVRKMVDHRFGISEYEQMQRDEAFSE
jgi:hypothetical protein